MIDGFPCFVNSEASFPPSKGGTVDLKIAATAWTSFCLTRCCISLWQPFFCWQAIINWLQESNVCPIEFWRNGLFEHLLVQRIPISCASHIFETCASYSNLVSKSSSVNLGHDHHSEWLRVVPVVFVPKMRIYPNDPQCTAIFMGKTGCETMRILGATFLIIIFPWPMVYNCL